MTRANSRSTVSHYNRIRANDYALFEADEPSWCAHDARYRTAELPLQEDYGHSRFCMSGKSSKMTLSRARFSGLQPSNPDIPACGST